MSIDNLIAQFKTLRYHQYDCSLIHLIEACNRNRQEFRKMRKVELFRAIKNQSQICDKVK